MDICCTRLNLKYCDVIWLKWSRIICTSSAFPFFHSINLHDNAAAFLSHQRELSPHIGQGHYFTWLLIFEATAKPVTESQPKPQTERTHFLLSAQQSPSRMSSWSECVCLSHSHDISSGQVMCLWTGRYKNADRQEVDCRQTSCWSASCLELVYLPTLNTLFTHSPIHSSLVQRRGWQASKLTAWWGAEGTLLTTGGSSRVYYYIS